MNSARYFIQHKVISWMIILLLTIGGCISFMGLGQLELPEFTIKTALVVTNYPGASPEQVEEEVTLVLEDAIQQMSQIKHVTSINSAGLSQIEVEMQSQYDKTELPQIWDELRRKVNDAVVSLPPGVNTPMIIDDFSDVYGFLMNITGPGYRYREIENVADLLRRELVLLPGIKKVSVIGAPQEQVVVEVSQTKMSSLGLDPNYIFSLLQNQNTVSNAGKVLVDDNRIRIHPTGEFQHVSELNNLMVSVPGSSQLIYLGDIAKVYKTTSESPSVLYRNQGASALSIGISFTSGVNVVKVSQHIKNELEQMQSLIPAGMNLHTVYDQGEVVDTAVSGFLVSLMQSVLIVIVVLLVFMGARSGLLMGAVLLITILGTFIVMNIFNIQLQSISLGALIIALGMLVDNAIVITEGVLIGLKKGQTRLESAQQIVKQSQWPLLGATVIAIIAFAPIGLSQDASGEFCGSLFKVLLISLSTSWFTAITITPFLCHLLFKDGDIKEENDVYQGAVFGLYRSFLQGVIRYRWLTVSVVIILLFSAMVGMSKVKNIFFPPSTTPMFMVDVWLPEGTDIMASQTMIAEMESYILEQPEAEQVVNITSIIGKGGQRFVLPYKPEKSYPAYSQLMIEMQDLQQVFDYAPKLSSVLKAQFPAAQIKVKLMENGPSPKAKLEARFYGSDPQVLRQLAAKTQEVFEQVPELAGIRHDWRNKTLMIRPQLNLISARQAGVSKSEIDKAMLVNFNGMTIGVYREQSHLMPIIARAPEQERLNANSLSELQVFSNEKQSFVPITQVVSAFESEWENPIIMRRDRKRVITVLADPEVMSPDTADSLFKKVKDGVEAIPLPDGYVLEWGGELEKSSQARKGIASSVPYGFLFMFLITIVLFNSVRQPLVIWLTVPLAIIGVASGLLLFDTPMSFMAILGMLSLSGMIIKNGIVLVDQMNVEYRLGKPAYDALILASVSRVRPVCMAALTTMLGMIPLLFDPFFKALAVTIIFGLGFATLLTLIVLPVLYSLFYHIKAKA